VLTSVCQPLQGYHRNPGGGHYLSYSSYMLFVDACIADPEAVYPFNKLVNDYVEGALELSDDILAYLRVWEANDTAFKELQKNAPVLNSIAQLSSNLSALAVTGIEAVEFSKGNNKPSKDWIAQSKIIVSNARKQGGRTEIQVVNAVESLIALCQ